METTTRPFFALYVVWHPSNKSGRKVADLLHSKFGRDLHQNVAGDLGLSVIYRNKAVPGDFVPLPIDWDEAEITAVVVLVDSALDSDQAWSNYVQELSQNAQAKGRLLTRLFPVVMEAGDRELQFEEQALRWDRWEGPDAERERRLVRDLTNEFSRMLRYRLDLFRRSEVAEEPFPEYLKKFQVFISHSKHDDDGESVARSSRDWLHQNSVLSSFFDVYDIPPGLSFQEVILHQIETSAFVALHTDSYSSRDWCRIEVIEAKRRHVPMVVVDCLRDIDPRSIPYMGNVPIVRMSSDQRDRIGAVTECLLDEVFRTYLWHCRVEPFRATYPNVLFTARPPELILLATLPDRQSETGFTIVYPEPRLGTAESRLFSKIAPNVRTLTLTKWMEENQ